MDLNINEYKKRHNMVNVGSGQTVIDKRTGYKWIVGSKYKAFDDKAQLGTYFKLIEDVKSYPQTRVETYNDFITNYYLPEDNGQKGKIL